MMNKEKRIEAIKQEFTEKRTKKLHRYWELKQQIQACNDVIKELIPELIKSGHARYKAHTNEYWITKDQLEEMPEEQQKQASIFRVNKTIKKIEVDKV
tara:strand:+ start:281 stop:574 length:294 start_codon:yes stop_codon:yes gene_type:complete